MKVQLGVTTCVVTREDGDPTFHGVRGARGESTLLHHVKLKLIEQGYDVIKKRMWKDGHMVDELQQYIRTRNTKEGSFAIFNNYWSIHGAEKPYNTAGQVELMVVRDLHIPYQ